jgi:hypothetical protein
MPMVGRVAADADCNRYPATGLEVLAGAMRTRADWTSPR